MEKTIVTSALPYANGPIHIGHLAGAYLPADIYTRFKRMMGDDVIYICGTDEHGTPITFAAEQKNVNPKEIVDVFHKQIHHSLLKAQIEFDHFSRTTTKTHYELTQEFFLELLNNGFIETKEEEHFFCSETNQFLPDRYVEGECPNCGYPKARGDECPKCGKWLEADKLKNPYSGMCKGGLSKKSTKHWYLKLDVLQPQLESWIATKKDWKPNVVNFIEGWFKEGLKPRAITRDLSWGVPLPLTDESAKNKVLYVWFDAPIGYISITKEWAEKVKHNKDLWKEYWQNKNTKLVHFIGKDNIPFHTIVWPSMLLGQTTQYVLPTDVPANEHLTIENEKISSSRGNAVWVEDVVEVFGVDFLRFYLASNAPENKDADFSYKMFMSIINTELVNVLGNLFQRVTSFIADKINGVVPDFVDPTQKDTQMLTLIEKTIADVKLCYEKFKVKEAVKLVIDLAREGNAYFQENEPWNKIKEGNDKVSTLLNVLVRLLEACSFILQPIIPNSARTMLFRLGVGQFTNSQSFNNTLKNYTSPLNPFLRKIVKDVVIFKKIEEKEIDEQIALLQKRMDTLKGEEKKVENMNEITIDDFKKIDIKTGTILSVEEIKKSEKLLKFSIKTGDEVRQILSGIKAHYPNPQELVGKHVAYVANLKPVTLMGELSQGMILSAENFDNGNLEVVEVSNKVGNGAKIK